MKDNIYIDAVTQTIISRLCDAVVSGLEAQINNTIKMHFGEWTDQHTDKICREVKEELQRLTEHIDHKTKDAGTNTANQVETFSERIAQKIHEYSETTMRSVTEIQNELTHHLIGTTGKALDAMKSHEVSTNNEFVQIQNRLQKMESQTPQEDFFERISLEIQKLTVPSDEIKTALSEIQNSLHKSDDALKEKIHAFEAEQGQLKSAYHEIMTTVEKVQTEATSKAEKLKYTISGLEDEKAELKQKLSQENTELKEQLAKTREDLKECLTVAEKAVKEKQEVQKELEKIQGLWEKVMMK